MKTGTLSSGTCCLPAEEEPSSQGEEAPPRSGSLWSGDPAPGNQVFPGWCELPCLEGDGLPWPSPSQTFLPMIHSGNLHEISQTPVPSKQGRRLLLLLLLLTLRGTLEQQQLPCDCEKRADRSTRRTSSVKASASPDSSAEQPSRFPTPHHVREQTSIQATLSGPL